MSPPSGKPKFADNERVLCYHGPLLYEAKCVKWKKDSKQQTYQGWNKNWDEWVSEDRILKVNTDNLGKKSHLLEQHVQSMKTTKKEKKEKSKADKSSDRLSSGGDRAPSTPTPTSSASSSVPGTPGSSLPGGGSSATPGGRKSESASTSRASTPGSERSLKRPAIDDDELSNSSHDEDTPAVPSVSTGMSSNSRRLSASTKRQRALAVPPSARLKVVIPEELKFVLVSDWDLVTHRKSLFSVPAKTSVSTILQEFAKGKNAAVGEVMMGIRDLFNRTLGYQLLYKIERNQYESHVATKSTPPCDMYGPAHLLRLMVKINGLLKNVFLHSDDVSVSLIENTIGDLLNFLETNRTKYFTSKNYVEASEEYLKDA